MAAKVVIVTGSREWLDYEVIHRVLDEEAPDLVVHGGAAGADNCAHGWCRLRGRPAIVVFPDYDKYGDRAPLRRNIRMLETYPNATVLAFPMAKSKGTWHTVKNAKDRDMAVKITEPEK